MISLLLPLRGDEEDLLVLAIAIAACLLLAVLLFGCRR